MLDKRITQHITKLMLFLAIINLWHLRQNPGEVTGSIRAIITTSIHDKISDDDNEGIGESDEDDEIGEEVI